ncbi:MAG: pentapeptide repeat-containing protein [Candidatus Thiodiazotropha sp.]
MLIQSVSEAILLLGLALLSWPSGADPRVELMRQGRCVECSLVSVDLSGLDLQGADLRGADLSGANLSASRLDGALIY